MDALHAIAYVSSAVRLPSSVEIDHLLRRARERNADASVTGLLLYHDGNFMQYIEGPPGPLTEIYRIICNDPLHHQIMTLLNEAVATREFSDWAMAFSAVTAPAFLTQPTRAPEATSDTRDDDAAVSPGRELLRQMWQRMGAHRTA